MKPPDAAIALVRAWIVDDHHIPTVVQVVKDVVLNVERVVILAGENVTRPSIVTTGAESTTDDAATLTTDDDFHLLGVIKSVYVLPCLFLLTLIRVFALVSQYFFASIAFSLVLYVYCIVLSSLAYYNNTISTSVKPS